MPRAPGPAVEGVQDQHHASVALLAAAVGRSRQTVQEWFVAGCPKDKPYSEVKVRLWAKAAGIEGLVAPSAEVAALMGEASAPRKAKEPDRIDQLRAELLQRDHDERDGKLVSIDAVLDLVEAITAMAVTDLQDLPELAVRALFAQAEDGAAAAPLSSAAVREQLVDQVREHRARVAPQARVLLRKHLLGARAPALPPEAGHGGTTTTQGAIP
jgi:hypothetical protein